MISYSGCRAYKTSSNENQTNGKCYPTISQTIRNCFARYSSTFIDLCRSLTIESCSWSLFATRRDDPQLAIPAPSIRRANVVRGLYRHVDEESEEMQGLAIYSLKLYEFTLSLHIHIKLIQYLSQLSVVRTKADR